MPEVPWLAVGDFNVVKSMDERPNFFEGMFCPSSSQDFQQFLYNLEFLDLPHLGPTFTWTDKRSQGFVAKKLDRFLANSCWFQSFPNLQVEFSPHEFSDHCAGWLFISNHTVKLLAPLKFSISSLDITNSSILSIFVGLQSILMVPTCSNCAKN